MEEQIIFEWEVPENLRKYKVDEDLAEAYRVVKCDEAVSGIIVYFRWKGEWKANPWNTRSLIRHLIDQLSEARDTLPSYRTERLIPEYSGKPDYEWDNFWKEIIVKNGEVDIDQLKKELSDYSMLIKHLSEIYMELSGGCISKPNTYPYEVISLYHQDLSDNYIDKMYLHDILDQEYESIEELKQAIRNEM